MEEQEFDFDTWFDLMRDHAKGLGYQGPIDKGSFEENYEQGEGPEYAAEIFVEGMAE